MAYEKIAAGTGGIPPATVKFYYPFADTFEHVSLVTTYKGKVLKDSNGNHLIDDYAVSEDEKDAVLDSLKRGVYDVFNIIFNITGATSDSVFTYTDITLPIGGAIVKASGGSIPDQSTFNANMLPILDKKIESALENYILWKWFVSVGLADNILMSKKDFDDDMDSIKLLLYKRRRPVIS